MFMRNAILFIIFPLRSPETIRSLEENFRRKMLETEPELSRNIIVNFIKAIHTCKPLHTEDIC